MPNSTKKNRRSCRCTGFRRFLDGAKWVYEVFLCFSRIFGAAVFFRFPCHVGHLGLLSVGLSIKGVWWEEEARDVS